MAALVVVVTFHSRSGATETLASSCAVGAVQGRALIRLRRVADPDPELTIAGHPDHRATLQRMQREYVAPTEPDLLGADAIVLVPPPGADPSAAEWSPLIAMLTRLGGDGRLAGKVGAVVNTGDQPSLAAFAQALAATGLPIVPAGPLSMDGATPQSATDHGRRVAGVARAVKQAAVAGNV
jgi:hypothetical protein